MSDRLRHWRPVLLSRRLRKRPVRVVMGGQEIVVFRTADGQIGALQGRCPHRGTLLSSGKVIGERLQCAYHGWCFAPDGHGYSPGSPRVPQRATSYDVAEESGLIWLKNRSSPNAFPDLAPSGYRSCHTMLRTVPAPVELLLDNFTEVEHTATGHLTFGYPLERLHEVVFTSRIEDGVVHSRSAGPQKWVPPWTTAATGVRTGDRFVVEWVTRGEPLHVHYAMHWEDPRSGRPRPMKLYEVAYFWPLGQRRSALAALYYLQLPPSRLPGQQQAVSHSIASLIRFVEFPRDLRLMQALEGQPSSLDGCRLSRFDASLSLQRRLFFPGLQSENETGSETESEPAR